MAKFYGAVGYGISVEDPEDSGIWVEQITEINYRGNVLRNSRNLLSGETLNDDVTVSNSISIVGDPYAIEHFFDIRYVVWAGVRWTVTSVDVEVNNPRLTLSLGSVYNGPTP
jgi:hypothetical protein